MRNIRKSFLFGTLIAMVSHCVGIWSETARNAAGIGFAETVDYRRLGHGFGGVTWDHLRSVRLMEWEYVAAFGMIAFLLMLTVRGTVPKWIAAIYLITLLASGGWIGLMLFPYLPFNLLFRFNSLDGEFFEEGIARMMMGGLWPWLVLIWTLAVFIKWRPGFMRSSATDCKSV